MQHLKISAVNTLIAVIDSNKVQLFTDTNGVIT
jgi:protein required for attachment to host cells